MTSGLLTRSAAKRLSRAIPNPFVRTLAIAAAGFAIEQLVYRTWRKQHRHMAHA
jgi:hypothetical protein